MDKADTDSGQIGSKYLKKMIEKRKPLFHLHGHVHERYGIEGRTVNGSYPDVRKFFSIDTDFAKVEFIDY